MLYNSQDVLSFFYFARPLSQSMKHFLAVFLLVLGLCDANAQGYEVNFPPVIIENQEFSLKIDAGKYAEFEDSVIVNGKAIPVFWDENKAEITAIANQDKQQITIGSNNFTSENSAIPAFWSIMPPLIAIAFALIFKEVLSALFLGIFSGAAIIGAYSGNVLNVFSAIFKSLSKYVIEALADEGHLSVIVFSVIIGGVVHIISKNGGMAAVVNRIAKRAKTPKSGQLSTYFLGFAIFFDDYANTLVVGNTMRPITDRLKISREKLAYIVDSTAAPIAAIAFVTTWIGAELGYISEAIGNSTHQEVIQGQSAYAIFFQSLPYSFYPLLTLIFMFFLIYMGKDFGPMKKFELNARKDIHEYKNETEEADETKASKAYLAVIPILCIVLGTLVSLFITGYSVDIWDTDDSFLRKISATIGNADSYLALLWSSLLSLLVAIILSVSSGKLSFSQSMEEAVEGFKTMVSAILILCLAWSLAIVTEDLKTAEFLSYILEGNVSAEWIPAITFILGAVVAFSTGSSWGTMAILYPLLLPAVISVGLTQGLDTESILPLFFNTTAGVLAGSVLGDHCSPISDTTILSSLATKCNHINHVKSQMPYALTVGSVALLIGIIPSSFGLNPFIGLALAIIVLFFIVKRFATTTA